MIVGVINPTHLNENIDFIKYPQVDIFEWRLDYLPPSSLLAIDSLKIQQPLIFTLRSVTQGGKYSGDEATRLTLLAQLAHLKPTYLDIEHHVAEDFFDKIHTIHPGVQIIRSYHNFQQTPNVEALFHRLIHPRVAIYKIVTYANHIDDLFAVANLVKKYSAKYKIVAHCLGPLTLPSRILGQMMGNYFQYGSIDDKAICPSLDTLLNIYHIHQLNPQTQLFAVLGDPIAHSQGDSFHNQRFKENHRSAVYLKIQLPIEQLPAFFTGIKEFPFQGFSITMPLKEAIVPYVTVLDPQIRSIGAINTLRFKDNRWEGTNTDGLGAVNTLKSFTTFTHKHLLIIGAGGAARAIAHQCSQENLASLSILNRTLSKAQRIVHSATAYDYTTFKSANPLTFDIVINTTPIDQTHETDLFNLLKPHLSPRTLVMNIDYAQRDSVLINKVKELGCKTVSPHGMYIAQALAQLTYWFET